MCGVIYFTFGNVVLPPSPRNFESKRRKRFPRSENEETTDRLVAMLVSLKREDKVDE